MSIQQHDLQYIKDVLGVRNVVLDQMPSIPSHVLQTIFLVPEEMESAESQLLQKIKAAAPVEINSILTPTEFENLEKTTNLRVISFGALLKGSSKSAAQQILETHSLSDLLKTSSLKRETWNLLKSLSEEN
tara:strand:+ start:10901 stop:11293 length:393 start_codon:yes stop_codon:yes gene_type:complete